MMKIIEGLKTNIEFSSFTKVSDLIFYDGPLLSHFINEVGDNYLYYWVDADDSYNRWVIVRTGITLIQDYLDKRTTLHDIITKPIDQFVYIVDIDDNVEYHNQRIVPVQNLPEEYTPMEDSYYVFEKRDYMNISSFSRRYNSGVLEIHISGDNVKYGSIPLHKFAPIVPKLEDIRKTMSSKFIKAVKELQKEAYFETQKEKKNKLKETTDSLTLDTQYEMTYLMAGSIRIILKPLQNHVSFTSTHADDFAKEFTELLSSGKSKEQIKVFSERYDKKTISKYNDFITFLSEEKLSIGIQWCNDRANVSYRESINKTNVQKYLQNLSDFDFSDEEELKVVGSFYSLNIKTGSYSFETIDGEISSTGYLDEDRKKVADQISFNKQYEVIINRKSSEPIGRKLKVKDTIVSFMEVPEEKVRN